jgi:hypothetical protein
MKENESSAGLIRSYISYDPVTGDCIWINTTSSKISIGDIAGTILCAGNDLKYIVIRLFGVGYKAHRIAWLLSYDQWPTGLIDHISCDGTDNRLCNLRAADRSQNQMNRRSRKTTGFKGVYRRDYSTVVSFIAKIKKDGKSISLGSFRTAEEAHAKYCDAAHELFGEFARAA